MSVTAMYVELLVVGLGGLIWTGLFISWKYNNELISLLSALNFDNNAAVIIPFVLSAAYVLGILIDKASKGIMEGFGKLIMKCFAKLFKKGSGELIGQYFQESLKPSDLKYEEIIVGSESATTVLNYMRSKIRIMRGSIFNFLLIGISGSGYLKPTIGCDKLSEKVLYAGIALAGITLGLYIYNERLCNNRVDKFCKALEDKSKKNDSPYVCKAEKLQIITKQDFLEGGQG